jgi:signal transduction histidine kinase/CheY-like chemotaxis protein
MNQWPSTPPSPATIWTRLQTYFANRFDDPKMPYAILVIVIAILSSLTSLAVTKDPVTRVSLNVMIGCLLILLLMIFKFKLSIGTLSQIGLWIGFVHISIITWMDGGVFSLKNNWLLVMMVMQYYMGSRRLGFIWLGLIILALLGQTWEGFMPVSAALQATGADRALLSLIAVIAPMLVIFLVPRFFQDKYNQALLLSQQRQRELQAKQAELEHTLQMREHFIASVSHELRTPMNAILGLNALLLDRVKNKPQAEKVLAYTRQSADHLMTVINDVLDYSQFVSGQLTARVERFELQATVMAAFELFKPRIESTKLHYACQVDPGVPPWVDTDRHRLMQVLVNLLGNAIKFTHNGSVLLRVQAVDGGVKFSVQDTGIGIAADQQQKIFERFSQAQPHIQSQYGGSGLGLTISLRLVQMLHGHMGLDSQPGVGSTFWFWLPLRNQPAPAGRQAMAEPVPSTDLPHLRFLVVDDHPVNRLLAKQVLQQHWPGCMVDECENGAKATQALQTGEPYDLMLIDMVMPVMDGIETMHWVRQADAPHIRGLPVLGLTANVSEPDLLRFQQAGLNGLLLKPFDLERLRGEVQRLVLHRSAPA